MKKALLIAVLMVSVMTVQSGYAQIQKGNFMVGGDATFDFGKSDGVKYSKTAINPTVAYFLVNRLALGLQGSLGATVYDRGSADARQFSTLAIGPLARFYFNENKFSVFAEAGYLHESLVVGPAEDFVLISYTGQDENREQYSYSHLDLGVGCSFFLNDHVSIDAILAYHKNLTENGYSRGQKQISLNFGFQIFL
ncbi:outer membrane beta-barrel protein [Fulvivirga ligni]|uniref:outer membrane beta-barrel protein n=1 Tax=Fulvivirga ligni TaxID=2904246 RepID=UPI001F41A436|nr:outer membrane beta-barrel protein [Fulvivirga ligni]UII20140.1 porin family protein [Fulvivirga ligni]